MRLLIDSDMLVFRSAAACEEWSPFNKEVLIKADPEETWRCIELRVEQCVSVVYDEFGESPEVILCFSPSKNYRYEVYPDYKSNRKGKSKPILYVDMKEKCERLYHCEQWDNIEADDVLGILQGDDSVICTGDKDLKQIAGYHLNLIDPDSGIYTITEAEGDALFYKQCIAGDPTDGYHGVPSLGMKKATALLETEGYNWSTVVRAYENAMTTKSKTEVTAGGKKRVVKLRSVNRGLGYSDALLTARLAYIMRYPKDYNRETGEVTLWSPT